MWEAGWRMECLRGVIIHASASGWWELGQMRRSMWRNEMDLNDHEGADY